MDDIKEFLLNRINTYNTIMYVQWHITNRCEERCLHCYLTENDTNLSISENKKIIDRLVEYSQLIEKPLFISFTGGDPLLYTGIWELLAYCVDKGVYVTIKGNPHFLVSQPDIIGKLKDLNVISYQLSLDGLKKTHDEIRSSGSYDKTLTALKNLVSSGMTSVVKMTLSDKNYSELTDVMRLVDDIGVSYIGISRVVCAGEAQKNNYSLKSNLWREIMQIYHTYELNHTEKIYYDPLWFPFFIENGMISFGDLEKFSNTPSGFENVLEGCTIWENSYSLHPNGDVYACSRIEDSLLGNIVVDTFESIEQNSSRFRQIENLSCNPCRYIKLCRGCRAIAQGIEGSYYGVDCGCWVNCRQD